MLCCCCTVLEYLARFCGYLLCTYPVAGAIAFSLAESAKWHHITAFENLVLSFKLHLCFIFFNQFFSIPFSSHLVINYWAAFPLKLTHLWLHYGVGLAG